MTSLSAARSPQRLWLRKFSRTFWAGAVALGLLEAPHVRGQVLEGGTGAMPSPWGISSSAGSFRNHAEWFPKMSALGIKWVRLFPEWQGFENPQGTWKWEPTDAMLRSAGEHGLQINAIFMGSPAWTNEKSHAFPMGHLDAWSTYVSTVVDRYQGQVKYWEVWNEGNGGFNDATHTTTDYARLASATYVAAKKADPQAQVGLTVASFDAPYLKQAILAQAKAGTPGQFDYLCIHPYEIADGLDEPNGEIAYLWMTRLLRNMLKAHAPEKSDVPIWITEVGKRLHQQRGRAATDEEAGSAAVKLYVMALAQGIATTQWFEAQDPAGEDQGFGLLARDGKPRAAYHAFQTMTKLLGAQPKYLGWLALGEGGRSYGFVFGGAKEPVLVAWAPVGVSGVPVAAGGSLKITDILGNTLEASRAAEHQRQSSVPLFYSGLPPQMAADARVNADKPFPWGGDFSQATVVSTQLGAKHGNAGIFPLGLQSNPVVTYADGSSGILMQGNQSARFFVHPSFGSLATSEYHVRITVRRVGPGNVGMNVHYEVADSQGRMPYKNRGQWYSVKDGTEWQTQTWHITDACFSKMWGYDFSIGPELSVPFVLGKVEVSTKPF